MPTPTTIPARHGAHALLHPGQSIRITSPSGHQVVDLWAFPLAVSTPSFLSMAQSRSRLSSIRPKVNDTFVDARRRAVLTMIEDSSSGVHDMLFPPCDKWRYEEAGAEGHGSCAANLRTELAAFTAKLRLQGELGSPLMELEEKIGEWGWTPEPLNLFMNVPVGGDGGLSVKRPACTEGNYVVLRAETECLVVMSACPNDLLDTNGGMPGDAEFEVLE
ncbi:hypothetical protein BU16DRAFT_532219 [Lophium mytilinum]|uniref:DUF1989 domain-containing protein n=1 Tax=Lophium mytilinum TaxID=390894 RepID=A0A6A6Q7K6_9PEZI|nr:hypothetical protein BU16DRAFT_532219 [Lophium mytilinum]